MLSLFISLSYATGGQDDQAYNQDMRQYTDFQLEQFDYDTKEIQELVQEFLKKKVNEYPAGSVYVDHIHRLYIIRCYKANTVIKGCL